MLIRLFLLFCDTASVIYRAKKQTCLKSANMA